MVFLLRQNFILNFSKQNTIYSVLINVIGHKFNVEIGHDSDRNDSQQKAVEKFKAKKSIRIVYCMSVIRSATDGLAAN